MGTDQAIREAPRCFHKRRDQDGGGEVFKREGSSDVGGVEKEMTTREWWEKAKPKERDGKIAEVIFGWSDPVEVAKGRSLKTAGKWYTVYRVAPGANWIGFLDGPHITRDGVKVYCGDPFKAWIPPHYSTDISDAFLVVDEMEKYDCDFVLERAGKQWHATILGVTASAPTAPEAICLAALLAAEGRAG